MSRSNRAHGYCVSCCLTIVVVVVVPVVFLVVPVVAFLIEVPSTGASGKWWSTLGSTCS